MNWKKVKICRKEKKRFVEYYTDTKEKKCWRYIEVTIKEGIDVSFNCLTNVSISVILKQV